MNRRTMLLVTAGILAVGAGLLTFNYLATSHHAASTPTRPVLVAVADIPAHTAINSSMVNVVMKPATDIDPGAMSSPGDVNGDVTLGPIPAGATITSSNTGKDEGPAQALHIPRGYRAISIPVDEVRDVSGLVQPGDKVDIIAVPPRVGNAQPSAATILRDVTVFAVGGQLQNLAAATPQPGQQPVPTVPRSVTLEVTPAQADLLAMADLNTTLRLALRPKGDRSGSTESIIFASTTFAGPPQGQSAPAPAAPAAPSKPGPIRPYSPVEVIDGDQIDSGPSSK
jgi:pilus assembly protein CpaB